MIYGRDISPCSNREGTEGTEGTEGSVIDSAAPVVSDAEMAGIVRAASALRIEAHAEDLENSADLAESVRCLALRVRGEVRSPKGRD
jgi:hypothetical protein